MRTCTVGTMSIRGCIWTNIITQGATLTPVSPPDAWKEIIVLPPRWSRCHRFSTKVLDIAHRHHTHTHPFSRNPRVRRRWPSPPLPGRPVCPLHAGVIFVLLWRVPSSERNRKGASSTPARNDDAHRCRHHHGVPLQHSDHVRLKWRSPLLGAKHPDRYHAPRSLDRDAFCYGGVAGP